MTPAHEPVVSVVIPTYERRDAVTEAVRSALDQTQPGVVVIVVDDGSTDGTAAHLHHRFAGERRLVVITQENGGVARARNRGVAEASTPWILFLDSDDRLLPRAAESQLACASRHPRARAVIADVALEGDWPGDAKSQFAVRGWRFPGDMQAMLRGAYMPPTGMLIDREVARALPFDAALPVFEDTDLLFRLHEAGHEVARNDEICAVHTRHATTEAGRQLTSDEAFCTLVKHDVMQRYAARMPDPRRQQRKLEHAVARYLVLRGRPGLARPFLARWLRRDPLRGRVWRWWFAGVFRPGRRTLDGLPAVAREILERAGVRAEPATGSAP